MECKKIREFFPAYVNSSASAENVALVETHLAVCNDCRKYLSELLDMPFVASKTFADDGAASLAKKRQNLDEPLTVAEYIALTVALVVFGFLVSIFIRG